MDEKNELEKKLLDKWCHITNPCGEIPLEPGNPMQKMTLSVSKILNNQENYLKKMFMPPEETISEDIDEYEKEISKNLLINHLCENCEFSSCEKEQRKKYGTCSVWKEKTFSLKNIIFPTIKKTYPSTIRGTLISNSIDKKDDSI